MPILSFYTYWNMEQSHVEGLYAAPLAQGLSIHKPKISSSYHSGPIGEGRKLHSAKQITQLIIEQTSLTLF